MLNKETLDYVKTSIKDINKQKDVDIRIEKMIKIKDDIRCQLNDELDELFSNINLKKLKINLEE